ncbi:MAG: hypothetical protein VR72_13055 [Clostridiaceae bacterium BRH_c20a]|nr:MAG: hypothetical protein VR72_13055 [Clostridiaceae bacterium BRH_c20a]
MEKIHGVLMAITIGLCFGLQPAINSTLGKALTPKVAAFHSILVTFIIIFLVVLFSNELPIYKNIVSLHPVYWMGGVLGFGIVFMAILTIPILGSSASIAIFVTVQLIVGSILDHFGLLGIERSPIIPKQLLGILVLIIGVKLILK